MNDDYSFYQIISTVTLHIAGTYERNCRRGAVMAAIFLRYDGSPIQFGLDALLDDAALFERTSTQITKNGGTVALNSRAKFACSTVFLEERPVGSVEDRHPPSLPDTYHYSYVHDCVKHGTVIDIRRYRVQRSSVYGQCEARVLRVLLQNWTWADLYDAPAPGSSSASSVDVVMANTPDVCQVQQVEATTEPSAGRTRMNSGDIMDILSNFNDDDALNSTHSAGRNKFSPNDDIDVLEGLVEAYRKLLARRQRPYTITGKKFWSQSHSLMPSTLIKHPPFSLWTRFVKTILPNLKSYSSLVDASTLSEVAQLANVEYCQGESSDSTRVTRATKPVTTHQHDEAQEQLPPTASSAEPTDVCISNNTALRDEDDDASTTAQAATVCSESDSLDNVEIDSGDEGNTNSGPSGSTRASTRTSIPFSRRKKSRTSLEDRKREVPLRGKRTRRRLHHADDWPLNDSDNHRSSDRHSVSSSDSTVQPGRGRRATERTVDSSSMVSERPSVSTTREPYTHDEDVKILRFLEQCPQRVSQTRGTLMWREMERHLDGSRTWQSLKNRFLKTIVPGSHRYTELPADFLKALKARHKKI